MLQLYINDMKSSWLLPSFPAWISILGLVASPTLCPGTGCSEVNASRASPLPRPWPTASSCAGARAANRQAIQTCRTDVGSGLWEVVQFLNIYKYTYICMYIYIYIYTHIYIYILFVLWWFCVAWWAQSQTLEFAEEEFFCSTYVVVFFCSFGSKNREMILRKSSGEQNVQH